MLTEFKKIVTIHNVGLSDENTFGSVVLYDTLNIGNTIFEKSDRGCAKLVALDEYLKECSKIDLIKIDVEGMEVDVLNGALKTIEKNKPVIVIESFNHKEEIDKIFNELNYVQKEVIRENEDYIYVYDGENK